MRQPFASHALAGAGLVYEIDGALFQHAGSDAAQHIVFGPLLKNDVIDASFRQKLTQQKS